MLFSLLHNGTKSGKKIFLTETVFFSQQLSFKIPFSWSWCFLRCYLDMRAARHSVYCGASEIELLTHWMQPSTQFHVSSYFFSPPFLNGSILSQEKIKSSGGKISPRRKRLQLCSHVQETEGMWGSLPVKWLSVLRCCTARWHNTVKECICQASSAKSEPIADLGGIYFFFYRLCFKGF